MKPTIKGLLESRGAPFKPVGLNAVLADVCTDLHVKVDETNADITTNDLSVVDGDTSQLRQVFQNLINNAIEYCGARPPRNSIDADQNSSR